MYISEAHGHTFILFGKICFLVITRNPEDVYGRKLVEMNPTGLPRLSKQLRDQNNSQKTEKTEIQNFKKKSLNFFVRLP